MSEELKRCPFCGGKAVIEHPIVGEDKNGVLVFYIECLSCECGTKYKPDEQEAIKVWNTRTTH